MAIQPMTLQQFSHTVKQFPIAFCMVAQQSDSERDGVGEASLTYQGPTIQLVICLVSGMERDSQAAEIILSAAASYANRNGIDLFKK